MINLKDIEKELDILNSEGTILCLYKDSLNNLYLKSFLKNGSGNVFFSVSINYLKDYLNSKITLRELYNNSKFFLVKFIFRNENKTYLKEEFIDSLQCGSDYYKDIPESMKTMEFEKKYGKF